MQSINVSSSEDEVEIIQEVPRSTRNNDNDSDDEIVFCGVVKASNASNNTFQDRSFLHKLGTDLIARNTSKNDKTKLSDFTPSPQLTIRKISAAEIKEDLSDDDVEIISEEVFERDCKRDKSDSNDALKRLTNPRGLGIIIHDSTESRNLTINIEDNDSSLQNKKVQLTFLGPRNERHDEEKSLLPSSNKRAYDSSSLKDIRGNSSEKSRKKFRSSIKSNNFCEDTSTQSINTKDTKVPNDLHSDDSRTTKCKYEKDSIQSKQTAKTEEPSFKVETEENIKLEDVDSSENNISIERIPKVEVSETPEIYDEKCSIRSPETLHSIIKIEECALSVETPVVPLPITSTFKKREGTPESIEPSVSATRDFDATSEPSTSNKVIYSEDDDGPGSNIPSIHEDEAVNSPESFSEQRHESEATHQDSGSSSSEEVDDVTKSEVSNLFNKFLETCYLKDQSEQMKLAQERLKKYFESAGNSIMKDVTFRRKLESSSNKLLNTDTNIYEVMKKILDDLKAHPKGDPRIRKLEKALRKINKKIQELEEAEVSSTDEEVENSYVLLDRYRSKAVQIYNKICELNNKPCDAERVYLRRVSFVGTLNLSEKNNQHDKILESIATQASLTLEKYYNKFRKFPDFQDVKKLVNKHCAEKKITKTEIIYLIAEQLFKGFGKELQNRRVYDDYTINFEYLPEGSEDPALSDSLLAEKLKENDKLRKKESEVLQEFVNKQILLKEKGIYDDDEDDKSKEKKKDKSKKRSNDSEHSEKEVKKHSGSSEEDDILKSVGLKKSLVEKEPQPKNNSENEQAHSQEESDNLL